jgi:uroporphyrinogen decarboxylase
MTHRERLMTALAHREPDRVPMDLGATRTTGVTLPQYRVLRAAFGVDGDETIIDRIQQVVLVDQRIQQALDVDARGVFLGPPDNARDVELPDGRYRDEWGAVRRKPATSFYYDLEHSPLAGEITVADIARHPWPDPDDPGRYRGLQERVRWLRQETDCAIVLSLPSGFIHLSQYLRGFEDWYVDMVAQPAVAGALLDAILEVNLAITARTLELVGSEVDIVFTGDDIGAQRSLQVSPQTYRTVIKPRQQRLFGFVRSHTAAPLMYHTCGAVAEVIPDLIDIGVGVLNPVQVSAAGMEPAALKRQFGKDLSFWGGIDTQRVLPHGSPDDVRAEVRRRFEELGRGGGWVLNAVHNLQPDVPVENIRAMYRAGQECVY